MKLLRYAAAAALTIALFACNDSLSERAISPAATLTASPRSSLSAAPGLLVAALKGARPRGPQDDMLRMEAELPGFGGFYIDSVDNVVVYLKRGSATSHGSIRSTLAKFYASWPNPREREIMRPAVSAKIVNADYSLSELIATENMIGSRLLSTPGIVGVGTSLRLNRVKVGFRDNATMAAGVAALVSAGAPREQLITEVWGDPVITANFDSKIRNTKAGIQISVGRRKNPFNGGTLEEMGSHGFVVTGNGTKYLMTAAHLANSLWGQNSKTGDSVFQNHSDPIINNRVGSVVISAPWLQQGACPLDSLSGAYPTYCTQSDVALATFSGADGDKKVATSTYEGQNGAAGTNSINNFYPIAGVLSPEYVKDSSNKGLHKSGWRTGTTTGAIDLPITKLVVPFYSWGNFAQSNPRITVSVIWYNVTRVAHMGWGGGDSGGAVFAGNGSPYHALGIFVAGEGANTDAVCTAGTGCSGYFTRWSNIEADLGFTLNPITGQ